MVDPAIAGLIGTGVGGVIGFAGTAVTAWATGRREKRARLFTEKRAVYSKALDCFGRIKLETDNRSPETIDLDGFAELVDKLRPELDMVCNEVMFLGTDTVRLALAEYQSTCIMAWGAQAEFMARIREAGSEEYRQALAKSKQLVGDRDSCLWSLNKRMRHDLGIPN